MSKTIIIVGFGLGVSTSVAERFGAEGFSVALIARSQARLTAGVEALKAKGISAAAFAADASDPISIRSAITRARAEFGRIGVLHWNASSGHGLGDLLAADPVSARSVFDIAIVGLLAAVQEVLPDLKEAAVRRAPTWLAVKVVFAPTRVLAAADLVLGPFKRLTEAHHQRDAILR